MQHSHVGCCCYVALWYVHRLIHVLLLYDHVCHRGDERRVVLCVAPALHEPNVLLCLEQQALVTVIPCVAGCDNGADVVPAKEWILFVGDELNAVVIKSCERHVDFCMEGPGPFGSWVAADIPHAFLWAGPGLVCRPMVVLAACQRNLIPGEWVTGKRQIAWIRDEGSGRLKVLLLYCWPAGLHWQPVKGAPFLRTCNWRTA